MLYSRRKRLQQLADREAAGEDLWTHKFDERVRAKLLHAVSDLSATRQRGNVMATARDLLLRDEGWLTLTGLTSPEQDFVQFIWVADDDVFPSCVEALHHVMTMRTDYYEPYGNAPLFATVMNQVFAEHRVAYELVEGQMVDFESKELHQEVVVPTLRLLAGRSGWDPVESAYRKALEEIATDPADAITDAGTALQEDLTVLGCEGNSLGKLATSAREKGLLAPHDTKIIDWVGADRSETGDAHNAVPASPADAWFAVHVVGALILRLTGDVSRA